MGVVVIFLMFECELDCPALYDLYGCFGVVALEGNSEEPRGAVTNVVLLFSLKTCFLLFVLETVVFGWTRLEFLDLLCV